VSHGMGAHSDMLCVTLWIRTAAPTPTVTATMSRVTLTAAVILKLPLIQKTHPINDDCCEVCLLVPREQRIAPVSCGHQRFSASCATEVHNQGRGCPICRTDIQMVLRFF